MAKSPLSLTQMEVLLQFYNFYAKSFVSNYHRCFTARTRRGRDAYFELSLCISLFYVIELTDQVEQEDTETAGLDTGHDPDKVADGEKADDRPPFETKPSLKHDGSVAPLIESTSDLELNSVALTSTQVNICSNDIVYLLMFVIIRQLSVKLLVNLIFNLHKI